MERNKIIKQKLTKLPDKPGCYLMRDSRGAIIYIGKARSLRKRVQSYFRPATLRRAPPRLRSLINSIADFDIVVVRSEAEALLSESNLIKQYRPRFNVLMRDDRRFLALRADPREPVPRLTTRRIQRNDGALYFGPFPSAPVVRQVLDFTEKRYRLRKCTPLRPDAETYKHCINDIIRYCSAPCVGRISLEDYRAQFDEACAFLRGERMSVIEEVKEQMESAAAEHDYEKAAILRDTWIALIEMVRQRGKALTSTPAMRAANAEAGLAELQALLGMQRLPQIIEGFDISNLFGTHSVASMVTAINGIPDKRFYRRFKIKSVTGSDDPRSMAEVIRRRYTRVLQERRPLPDLIMVDGGVTQLRATRAALAELGINGVTTIGLAERHEEVVVDDGREPLLLERDSLALRVLTQLRDEAHRFALEYHRRLRSRLIRESALDEIHGIGPAKKAALLRHFGSVQRLARASLEEIAAVKGIGTTLAEAIKRTIGN